MRVRARLAALGAVLALLVGGAVTVPAEPAQAASSAIGGIVYAGQASTSTYLAGVDVTAYKYDRRSKTWVVQATDQTDTRGRYAITGLPSGDYRVLFSARFLPGGWGEMYYPTAYQFAEASVLTVGTYTNHDRVNAVLKRTAAISGVLIDPMAADNAPVRTPVITLSRQLGGTFSVFTPLIREVALRSFTLRNLPPGTYRVCVSDPGPAPAIYATQCWREQLDPAPFTSIQLEADETYGVQFELRTPFADIPGTHPNATEINWMYRHGIELGQVENGVRTFRPLAIVSRQEVARYFHRLGGSQPVPPPTAPVFTDVPATAPFALELKWAKDSGLISANPDGSFRPADPITNAAAVEIIYRSHTNNGFVPPTVASFTDVPVGSPSFTAIEWAKWEGITSGSSNGDGTFSFRPNEPVTRQAMAVYMYLGIQAYGN
jgi:hypothetical protein